MTVIHPRFQGVTLNVFDRRRSDGLRLSLALTGTDHPQIAADEIIIHVPYPKSMRESQSLHLKSARIGQLSQALTEGKTAEVQARLANTLADVLKHPDDYQRGYVIQKGVFHTHTSMMSGAKPWDTDMLPESVRSALRDFEGKIQAGLTNLVVSFDEIQATTGRLLWKKQYVGPQAIGQSHVPSGPANQFQEIVDDDPAYGPELLKSLYRAAANGERIHGERYFPLTAAANHATAIGKVLWDMIHELPAGTELRRTGGLGPLAMPAPYFLRTVYGRKGGYFEGVISDENFRQLKAFVETLPAGSTVANARRQAVIKQLDQLKSQTLGAELLKAMARLAAQGDRQDGVRYINLSTLRDPDGKTYGKLWHLAMDWPEYRRGSGLEGLFYSTVYGRRGGYFEGAIADEDFEILRQYVRKL